MTRTALFGGSFDPVHLGHLAVARDLCRRFRFDRFFFLPAFHAPHKPDSPPTSACHRFAMLAIATAIDPRLFVSSSEIERRERRFTFDTLTEHEAAFPYDEFYFVMGADSWMDIRTWHRWEELLGGFNHIVMSRPGSAIGTEHVSEAVRRRIVREPGRLPEAGGIILTETVNMDISSSRIRRSAAAGDPSWQSDVTEEVAKYIEKYNLYK
jgi:nicotinate-nucleotide adenylyltransferase